MELIHFGDKVARAKTTSAVWWREQVDEFRTPFSLSLPGVTVVAQVAETCARQLAVT